MIEGCSTLVQLKRLNGHVYLLKHINWVTVAPGYLLAFGTLFRESLVYNCACEFHLCGVCACVLVRSRPRWWVQRLPDCYWLHLCCNRPRDGAPNPIFARSEPHSPPTQANRRAGHFHPDLTRKQHTMLLAGRQCVGWNICHGCTKVFPRGVQGQCPVQLQVIHTCSNTADSVNLLTVRLSGCV